MNTDENAFRRPIGAWRGYGEVSGQGSFDDSFLNESSFAGNFRIQDLEANTMPHQLDLEPMNLTVTPVLGQNSGITKTVEPVLVATFILKDRAPLTSKDSHEFLRLDVEFEPDINGHMDRTVSKWSRITQQDGSLQKLLDINVIDIDE